jgi:hypothetical protein
MVKGRYTGGLDYSTEMIDLAGPILSALVQKVFGK